MSSFSGIVLLSLEDKIAALEKLQNNTNDNKLITALDNRVTVLENLPHSDHDGNITSLEARIAILEHIPHPDNEGSGSITDLDGRIKVLEKSQSTNSKLSRTW